jgi:beta-ribofuranosylaminobenzene 5'-phosphate synthase
LGSVVVQAHARLHANSLWPYAAFQRAGIGFGFSITNYLCQFEVGDDTQSNLRPREQAWLAKLAGEMGEPVPQARFTRRIPAHFGLGSGTQHAMALAVGACAYWGAEAELGRLAELIGRASFSGVGLGCFQHGGFVSDAGYRVDRPLARVPVAAALPMPPDWAVALYRPTGLHARRPPHLSVDDARDRSHWPPSDPPSLVAEITGVLVPAIIEHDFQAAVSAMTRLVNTTIKKWEIGFYPSLRENMLAIGEATGNPAFLSSSGPTLYQLHPSDASARSAIRAARSICTGFEMTYGRFSPSGHIVRTAE